MLSFKVTHVGVYRMEQKGEVRLDYHCICLYVSGIRHYQFGNVKIEDSTPLFLLGARGMNITYDLGPDRENWVIILATDAMRLGRDEQSVEIRSNGRWMAVPCVTAVSATHIPGWQREFQLMRELFSAPMPRNLMRLELGVMNVLRYIVDQNDAVERKLTPAGRFRALLERSHASRRSLTELSREAGYSPEHLRELFRKEYGTAPAAYRMSCRMAEAMELVTHSNLSVKEMAFRLQFRHLSHFSMAFKKAFDLSPKQAIASFRR
jgi:AraC-like DNA-binding protein